MSSEAENERVNDKVSITRINKFLDLLQNALDVHKYRVWEEALNLAYDKILWRSRWSNWKECRWYATQKILN